MKLAWRRLNIKAQDLLVQRLVRAIKNVHSSLWPKEGEEQTLIVRKEYIDGRSEAEISSAEDAKGSVSTPHLQGKLKPCFCIQIKNEDNLESISRSNLWYPTRSAAMDFTEESRQYFSSKDSLTELGYEEGVASSRHCASMYVDKSGDLSDFLANVFGEGSVSDTASTISGPSFATTSMMLKPTTRKDEENRLNSLIFSNISSEASGEQDAENTSPAQWRSVPKLGFRSMVRHARSLSAGIGKKISRASYTAQSPTLSSYYEQEEAVPEGDSSRSRHGNIMLNFMCGRK